VALTSDIVPIAAVNLLDAPVPERELAHPVDTPTHTCSQAEISIGRRRVKTIRHEVVIAKNNISARHQYIIA